MRKPISLIIMYTKIYHYIPPEEYRKVNHIIKDPSGGNEYP